MEKWKLLVRFEYLARSTSIIKLSRQLQGQTHGMSDFFM